MRGADAVQAPPAPEPAAPPTPPSMPSFAAPEPPRAEEPPTPPAPKPASQAPKPASQAPKPTPHLRAIGPHDAPTDGALAKAPQHDHEWNGVTPPSRRGGSGRFLTDVLVDLGFVEQQRVEAAVEAARQSGRAPEKVLLEQGEITEDQLARAIGERYGLDHLDLTAFPIDMAAANLIDSSAAKRYEAVPVAFAEDKRAIVVAMADPANVLAVDDIAMLTRLDVRPAVASREDIATLVARLDRFGDSVREAVDEDQEQDDGEVVELHESADDAPIVKLVNSIIAQAAERGASDIHFEPDGRELRVRFRIDGVLSVSTTIPSRMVAGVVSRMKIMAELDIAEKRIPQDGRVEPQRRRPPRRHPRRDAAERARRVGRDAHPRQGRRCRSGSTSSACRRESASASSRPSRSPTAPCSSTGPTGSGKSTTLYAALQQLNTTEKNIITIEDPVEYQLEGITQVQVNPKRRPHLRQRAALDDARRPRHHHGRRDPRRRDGADRDRVRADRPPRALDAAHERRRRRRSRA